VSRTISIVTVFLFALVNRLPAPIQEVPENPTPAPEQSAKPKPKRTAKPKARESSESSTKSQTPSSTPKSQATPNRNPFDGTWRGTLNADYTMVIRGAGTNVTQTTVEWGTSNWSATCDGISMRWKTIGGSHTFTPNPDGKTAFATATSPGFLGIGAGSWSGVFRKTSP
jgi:hypothetical protein